METKNQERLCKALLITIFIVFLLDYSSLAKGIPPYKSVFMEHQATLSPFTGMVFAMSDFSKTILGALILFCVVALSIPLLKPDTLKAMNPIYLFSTLLILIVFNAFVFLKILVPLALLTHG